MLERLNSLYIEGLALSLVFFTSGCMSARLATPKQKSGMAYEEISKPRTESDSIDNINSADRLNFRDVLAQKAFSFYHSGKTAAVMEGNDDQDKLYLHLFLSENGIQYVPDYKGYFDKYSGKRLSYPDLTERLKSWTPPKK